MEIDCPNCNETLEIDDSLQGQTIECPGCGVAIVLAAPKPPPSPSKKRIVLSGRSSQPSSSSLSSSIASRPVPTHLGWAIFVTILGAGSLFGIIAIIFAAMASGANARKDYADAKSKAKVASILSWLAFFFDLILIAFVVLWIVIDVGNARYSSARSQIEIIKSEATLYNLRVGHNPTSIADLRSSTRLDGQKSLPQDVITDPWGNEFQLRLTDGGMLDIRSAGPDGLMNTSDDISNWGL